MRELIKFQIGKCTTGTLNFLSVSFLESLKEGRAFIFSSNIFDGTKQMDKGLRNKGLKVPLVFRWVFNYFKFVLQTLHNG